MAGYRTLLRMFSMILIVVAVLGIVAGIIVLLVGATGGELAQLPEYATGAFDGNADLMANIAGVVFVSGIVGLVGSVVQLVVGILGVSSSKKPDGGSSFYYAAIVGMVVSIITAAITVFCVFQDTNAMGSAYSSILAIAFLFILLWISGTIRKSGQAQASSDDPMV